MYNCRICRATSEPGESELRHVIYRMVKDVRTLKERKEVAREIPVCRECHNQLTDDPRRLGVLVKHHRPTYEMRNGVLLTPRGQVPFGRRVQAVPVPRRLPKCDLCGDPADGQVTADTALCLSCIRDQ